MLMQLRMCVSSRYIDVCTLSAGQARVYYIYITYRECWSLLNFHLVIRASKLLCSALLWPATYILDLAQPECSPCVRLASCALLVYNCRPLSAESGINRKFSGAPSGVRSVSCSLRKRGLGSYGLQWTKGSDLVATTPVFSNWF